MKSIVVVGAGPAGAAVALGLRRLGFEVCVVSEWRRFAALEGVSQRVLQALRGAGLNHALAVASEPSWRRVNWNGESHAQNVEALLDRPRFDRGLRDDLHAAGVRLIEARVLNVRHEHGRSLIELDGAPFKKLASKRAKWAVETSYVYPGPIQFFGPAEVADITTITLMLEKGK